MKPNLIALALSVIACALSAASLWRSVSPHPAPAIAAPAPAEPDYPLEDKMNRLHRLALKLGRALDQENLTLAAFYHHEMDAIAEEIVVHGVIHEDKPVGYMASLMLQPPLAYLESSLEHSDLPGCRRDYLQLLKACNTCHTGIGIIHPPIVPPPPLESESPDGVPPPPSPRS
ncbi:MAG: hypothetical protein HYV95_10145 [Opitutae bacterium]|nr:hypothetical protein [Opitutae bacterium]